MTDEERQKLLAKLRSGPKEEDSEMGQLEEDFETELERNPMPVPEDGPLMMQDNVPVEEEPDDLFAQMSDENPLETPESTDDEVDAFATLGEDDPLAVPSEVSDAFASLDDGEDSEVSDRQALRDKRAELGLDKDSDKLSDSDFTEAMKRIPGRMLRIAAKSIVAIPGLVNDPINRLIHGDDFVPTSQLVDALADEFKVSKAEGRGEQFIDNIAEAATGAGLAAKGAKTAANVLTETAKLAGTGRTTSAAVLDTVGSNIGIETISAASGVAAQQAAEDAGGGPTMQITAALLGALAPAAAGKLANTIGTRGRMIALEAFSPDKAATTTPEIKMADLMNRIAKLSGNDIKDVRSAFSNEDSLPVILAHLDLPQDIANQVIKYSIGKDNESIARISKAAEKAIARKSTEHRKDWSFAEARREAELAQAGKDVGAVRDKVDNVAFANMYQSLRQRSDSGQVMPIVRDMVQENANVKFTPELRKKLGYTPEDNPKLHFSEKGEVSFVKKDAKPDKKGNYKKSELEPFEIDGTIGQKVDTHLERMRTGDGKEGFVADQVRADDIGDMQQAVRQQDSTNIKGLDEVNIPHEAKKNYDKLVKESSATMAAAKGTELDVKKLKALDETGKSAGLSPQDRYDAMHHTLTELKAGGKEVTKLLEPSSGVMKPIVTEALTDAGLSQSEINGFLKYMKEIDSLAQGAKMKGEIDMTTVMGRTIAGAADRWYFGLMPAIKLSMMHEFGKAIRKTGGEMIQFKNTKDFEKAVSEGLMDIPDAEMKALIKSSLAKEGNPTNNIFEAFMGTGRFNAPKGTSSPFAAFGVGEGATSNYRDDTYSDEDASDWETEMDNR